MLASVPLGSDRIAATLPGEKLAQVAGAAGHVHDRYHPTYVLAPHDDWIRVGRLPSQQGADAAWRVTVA